MRYTTYGLNDLKELCRNCFYKMNAIYTLAWLCFSATLTLYIYFYTHTFIDGFAPEILIGCGVFIFSSFQRFRRAEGWTFLDWLKLYILRGSVFTALVVAVGYLISSNTKETIRIMGNGDAQYGQTSDVRQRVFEFISKDISTTKSRLEINLKHNYQPPVKKSKNANQPKEEETKAGEGIADVSVVVNDVWKDYVRKTYRCSNDHEDNPIEVIRPHIIELDVVWVADLVKQDVLIPLDDLKDPSRDFYSFGVTNQIGLHGKQDADTDIKSSFPGKKEYARPFFLNVGLLMYNTKYLTDPKYLPNYSSKDSESNQNTRLPEPNSWNNLYDRMKLILDRAKTDPELMALDLKGFVFQGDDYEGLLCCFLEMLWAHGGSIEVNTDGVPNVEESPKVLETLLWYQMAIRDGVIPPEVFGSHQEDGLRERNSEDLFLNGNVLVHRNWPRTLDRIQNKSKYSLIRPEINVFKTPLGIEGVNPRLPKMALGGWVYAITKYAKEDGVEEQAMRVIEEFTSKRWFDTMVRSQQLTPDNDQYSMRVPANEDIVERRRGDNLALDVSWDYLTNRDYRSRPIVTNYLKFSEAFTSTVHEIMLRFVEAHSSGELPVTDSEITIRLAQLQNDINEFYD